MVKIKSSDILKLVLVIQFVEFCIALPLNDEVYDAYDEELSGYPIPIVAPSNYWQQKYYAPNHIHPSYNERNIKAWLVPPKRNSELINSLLGLPKNLETAGK